jgi:hypothetical protein
VRAELCGWEERCFICPDGTLRDEPWFKVANEIADLRANYIARGRALANGAQATVWFVRGRTWRKPKPSTLGGDRISARRMREDLWEFAPTHKLWLCSNYRPAIRGTEEGIWRAVNAESWQFRVQVLVT